jgi:hypothetical protein
MNFFDYIRNKLFSGGQPENYPVIHEELKRKEKEVEKYEKWKISPSCNELLSFVHSQFELSKLELEDQSMIRVLNTKSSYGFMLRFPNHLSVSEFEHFFDLLKEKFIEYGYKSYSSDRKIYNRPDHVEKVERHFIKPRLKNLKPPLNQLFGNITIELISINDTPTHIKFLCNNFHDASYTNPLSMDELMQVICSID